MRSNCGHGVRPDEPHLAAAETLIEMAVERRIAANGNKKTEKGHRVE